MKRKFQQKNVKFLHKEKYNKFSYWNSCVKLYD